MDKIALLGSRRKQAEEQNKAALDFARGFLDEASFVETDSFYFAGNDLVDNGTVFGEGVVTGSGSVGGIPVALFVQNFDVMKGGLSKGQADKIVKCMDGAELNDLPLVCVLHTAGARLGEGIRVLDGYARVLRRLSDLEGRVPILLVVKGEVFGILSVFAEFSDFVFVMKDGVLASTSPAILTAKAGKDRSDEFFAAKSLAARGVASRVCKDTAALKADVAKLLDLLAGGEPVPSEEELNVSCAQLNWGYQTDTVVGKVLDKNTFFELRAEYAPELRVGLARIGGYRVGVALCSDEGTELSAAACRKYADFLDRCDDMDIPFVSFVNAKGFRQDLSEEDALIPALSRVARMASLTDTLKIAVIAGVAAGSVYTLFASKEMGYHQNYAWATASISLLAGEQGAELAYAEDIKKAKNRAKAREEAAKKYAEVEGDIFAAVAAGSVDEVIEPSLTRQYLLSVLVNYCG